MTVQTQIVIFNVIHMINTYLLLCDDPPTCFGTAVQSGRLFTKEYIYNKCC